MTILELVERERAHLRRLHVIGGLALALGVTALVLALGASMLGSARWMSLPRPVPFVVWLLVVAADVAVVIVTARRLERRATRHSVAAAIEREQAMRAGALRGALEVADSGALGRRAAAALAEQLAPVGPRLAPGEQKLATRGAAQATGVATVALAALAFAAPRFNDGLLAIMRPVSAWNGTLLPRLQFQNLPPVVLRGESLRLHVAAPRRSTIQVVQRTPGEAWSTQTVNVDSRSGTATIETGPLRGDLTVIANDGRSVSDTAVVHVTDRPFVGAVTMRAVYPAYLGRQPEGLPIGEPARVPQGTVIEIAGRASTALRGVRLAADGDTVALGVNERSFSGKFEAKKSGRFTWMALGVGGPIADLPLPLELDVVADSAPRVELVAPAVDTVVAADDRVTLHATASDDHGIAKIEVVSWRSGNGGTEQPTAQRVSDATATVWDGSPTLDLAQRGLKPGDALHVKIVATDNSPWAQRGESREVLLKVPTLEERRAIARAAADSAVSQAQAAASAEKSLEQRTSAAARDQTPRQNADAASNASGADKKDAMSYDAAEKAKAVAKDQRALADQVKQLQKNAEQLQQQLKQAGALDSSLARQLQEAQALLRDALTPELLAQMQKLDQATQQLSRDQAQSALRDLQAMQEKLREQLEKSAEMLKRAALEGAMQTLKDEAKDIADRDRALADSLAAHKADAQARQDQQADAKQLADRSQRFEDELKKLKDRLDQANADPGARSTEEARQHANAAEEAMRQAAGQKRDGKPAGDKTAAAKDANQQRDASQRDANQQQAGDSSARGQTSAHQRQNQGANPNQQRAGQGQQQQQQAGQGNQGRQANQNQGQQGEQSGAGEQNARDAAEQMQRASDAMQQARASQVSAWKSELTNALDQSIQEMLQMARQEQQLEQQARSGQSKPDELRGQQSAIKQGLDDAAKRLQQEGQKTSLLSGRSQRAVSEAQQKVSDAMQSTGDARGSQQSASTMGDAADALNRAAASLARDRERANTSGSATGFAEMLQQMQEMAKKQGSINAQAQGLLPGMGQSMSSQMQATARALAREQRQVAQQLDELGENAGGDRAGELAKEAKQLAEALEGGRLDATTLARQQQLFRRLLDAGRSLQKDEREDTNKREATSAKGGNEFKPENTNATGRAALKFREPTWDELRGLSADERRAILEYFKRINAQNPNP